MIKRLYKFYRIFTDHINIGFRKIFRIKLQFLNKTLHYFCGIKGFGLIGRKNILDSGLIKIAVLFSAIFITSCSQVKFVPEDKYLINKIEVKIDNPNLDKETAKSYIKEKENYKIIGFLKFHLFLYNLSSKKKDEGWLKRIGEQPRIYDEILSQRSEEQLKQYAQSKGYFRAKVESSANFKEKKQKVDLSYKLNLGEQYKIRRINYLIPDSTLKKIYFNDRLKQELDSGDPFDLEYLEEHRSEIVRLFRNNGYYYFSSDDVMFLADTSSLSRQVLLDLLIQPLAKTEVDSSKVFRPFYLNHFYYSVLPGNTAVTATRDSLGTFSDTIKWDNSTLYENKDVTYPSALFDRTMQMKKGDLYNYNTVENTFFAFNQLRQFRFVDIQFRETRARNDSNLLDCYIRLAPLSKQSTSFDIEGTNTSGNFGVAGNVTYQHRNLFRGAEVFEINLRGATERLQHLNADATDYFNTKELGIESSIMIPKLLGPGNYINNFERFLPKTVITLGYNYQQRPEYTRTITNLKFGYDWKTTEDLRNIWNLIDFNKVRIFEYDPSFLDRIQDLYIKSSFTNHLIFAMNYSLIYNNQRVNTLKKYTFARFNVESSGNLLWALAKITNSKKVEVKDTLNNLIDEYNKVLNTRFAQYIKTDVEFRQGYKIDEYNSVVGRAFFGIGIPYGNFGVLPFEKQYFTGGANGIRAWPVRSLGPGTYKASPENYPNQTADVKLELNAEYRFKLIGFLEGALFLDAGNIWAINEKDNREGALFSLNTFYKQMALGTGAGLRFDFSYFIFRLDLGVKLRDPSQSDNAGWIIGSRSYNNSDLNLNFAIGYPF